MIQKYFLKLAYNKKRQGVCPAFSTYLFTHAFLSGISFKKENLKKYINTLIFHHFYHKGESYISAFLCQQ